MNRGTRRCPIATSTTYELPQTEANIFYDVHALTTPVKMRSIFTTRFNSFVTTLPRG